MAGLSVGGKWGGLGTGRGEGGRTGEGCGSSGVRAPCSVGSALVSCVGRSDRYQFYQHPEVAAANMEGATTWNFCRSFIVGIVGMISLWRFKYTSGKSLSGL